MKKRLLITSIVMMLVVAVALSTATYAWFTSNTQVTANHVILTAATMEGDALLISHAGDNTDLSQEINLVTNGDYRLYPATPNSESTFTSTIAQSGFMNLEVDGSNTAKSTNISNPNKSYYTDTFYIYNKGFTPVTITPTVSIYYNADNGASYDAARSVRVAIIEKVGTAVSSSSVTLGSAVLKNIYEFDDSATATEAVYSHPDSFVAGMTYYSDDAGTAYSGETITASNFAANKASLYILTGNKCTAKNGALGTYGASTTDDPATANSAYTNAGITYTAANYTAIAAPASGTYVANQYTIVVWLEGWDAQCTNAMSAGLFRIGVTFQKA